MSKPYKALAAMLKAKMSAREAGQYEGNKVYEAEFVTVAVAEKCIMDAYEEGRAEERACPQHHHVADHADPNLRRCAQCGQDLTADAHLRLKAGKGEG